MVRAPKFSHLFLPMSVLALAACGGSQTSAPSRAVVQQPVGIPATSPPPVVLVAENEVPDPLSPLLPQSLSPEDRMARLEEAVTALRTDYDAMMPAFARLNVTNARVQALLDQMEAERGGSTSATAPAAKTTVTKTTSSSAKTVKSETVKKTPPKPVAPKKAAVPVKADPAVKAVRLGEHPGKTRIVVDLVGVGKITPSYDLDSAENILVIDLPGISAKDAASSLPKPAGVVSGMATSETSSGSTLVVQLKKGSKVLSKDYVKAEGAEPAKLVFDVGAGV